LTILTWLTRILLHQGYDPLACLVLGTVLDVLLRKMATGVLDEPCRIAFGIRLA